MNNPRQRIRLLCAVFALTVMPLSALAAGPAAVLNASPATAVSVASQPSASKPSVDQDIRDIRGPVSIPPWWRWLVLAGAVTLVSVAVVLSVRLARRRRRVLTPRQRALERLRAALALAQSGHAREYAIAASAAVREYIEEEFALHAESATTDEFFQALVALADSPLGEHQAALSHFLAACDLAKFARFQLDIAAMESLDTLARELVVGVHQTTSPAAAATRAS